MPGTPETLCVLCAADGTEDGLSWDWSPEVIGPAVQGGGDNERPRVAVDSNGDIAALFVGQLALEGHDAARTSAFVPNAKREQKQ